ncbi:DnaJ domain-containing protein, partial [Blastocladiella britannica]
MASTAPPPPFSGADSAQDRPGPSLYDILEVPRDADAASIKRSYRKMALKYHPDKNPGNEEKFQEIQRAFTILSDEKKRDVYDRYGEIGL